MNRVLSPGTILRERYKIIELVGQGGMGAVYQAEDLRLEGRRCAIKEVHPQAGASPTALEQGRQQFQREASILARLDHPNLPKVSDYFSYRGRDYLVMDFVAGRDLKQLVDEARYQGKFLAEKQVLEWAEQLCDALAYLHGQEPPVLHRDVKPANIKLTPQNRIKLVDFGLVKPLDLDDPRTVTILRGLGSLQYTPLEQYGGMGHTDVRSDIYSLGATLYHLLTGRPPQMAQERFIKPDSLIAPRDINPRLSARTERAVLRAMAMHPDERPQSIEEFRQALISPLAQVTLSLPVVAVAGRADLRAALEENTALIALVLVLVTLALLITLRA